MLAVACLGVLKWNGLHGKTDYETPSAASFFPIIETKTVPSGPLREGIARVGRMGVALKSEAGNPFRVETGSEGTNHIHSVAMDRLKNGK